MARRWLWLVLCVACGCGGSTGMPARIERRIGAMGGTVAASDGTTIEIPPGALAQEILVTLEPLKMQPMPPGVVPIGTPYEIGPTGTTFASPVTVTLPWSPSLLPPARSRDDIKVYTASDGTSFSVLPPLAIDDKTVRVSIDHLSIFVAGVPKAGTVMACAPGMDRIQGACATCLAERCNDGYVACFGADWSRGDFTGGHCGPYFRCICDCKEDPNCSASCMASEACGGQCGEPLETCEQDHCAAECSG